MDFSMKPFFRSKLHDRLFYQNPTPRWSALAPDEKDAKRHDIFLAGLERGDCPDCYRDDA